MSSHVDSKPLKAHLPLEWLIAAASKVKAKFRLAWAGSLAQTCCKAALHTRRVLGAASPQ